MNKQPEATAATRQKLVDAFWKQLERCKLEKITVKSITDCAGYNRSTFYQYFSDVYDIVETEEERILEGVRDINPPRKLLEQQADLSQILVPFIEQNANKIALLVQRRGSAFTDKLSGELYPFFLKQFALDDSPDLRVMFALISGAVTNGLVAQQKNPECTIEQVFGMAYSIATKGVLSLILGYK